MQPRESQWFCSFGYPNFALLGSPLQIWVLKILTLSGSGKYVVIWGLPWGKRANMFNHEGCLVRLSLVNIGNGGYIRVWMPKIAMLYTVYICAQELTPVGLMNSHFEWLW